MELKRMREFEVPPKIRFFINGVIATPLENIEEPLRSFIWDFGKGDFNHWVNLFNHFNAFFWKYIQSRKDLQVEDDFSELNPPFPKEAVLQIFRVARIIIRYCTNKHSYSLFEYHLSSLLTSTDADVVEACLQTLSVSVANTTGKYIISAASLKSKLFAFAQGWGGKEEGLGLIACAIENGSNSIVHDLGSTLHFEFYAANDSSNELSVAEQPIQGLQIIHLPNINACQESDLELLCKLVKEYKVPPTLRFSLLTRLRFARAFSSLASRQQYTHIRLHAFVILVGAFGDTDALGSFFNTEPEFINELVTILSYEDEVPDKIRNLCLLSLIAICRGRSRQPSVLTAVTSGGNLGIISSFLQKSIDSVVSNSTKQCIISAYGLLTLVTALVSSSSGCSALLEAGFIPTLLPLLKDTDPQHLLLVTIAVHVLQALMHRSNPAASLFRDFGGLNDTVFRLNIEVSHVERNSNQQGISIEVETSASDLSTAELDSMQPLYSEAFVSCHRRSLMKALLCLITLGTPGTTARVFCSEESLLLHCLFVIFRKAKEFGGEVFSFAAIVMSDHIHKDPTCFSIIEAAGLPSAYFDAIMDCPTEAITCIPKCLNALCLSNSGLQAVKDHNALRCFVKIFTSREYLRALMATGNTPESLSSGLSKLMCHVSSLRGAGVDMLIEILKTIERFGLGLEASSSVTDVPSCSTSIPMETDTEDMHLIPSEDVQLFKFECSEHLPELSSDTSVVNVDYSLPEFISNVSRLLETILLNTDTCRIFVEKKGIEAVLQLFTLPLMPFSVSVGQSISAVFKKFSTHHSASLARALCSFLREHLTSTTELFVSIGGMLVTQVEAVKRLELLRSLSTLEGILSLSNSLLKETTMAVSELVTSDANVLRDLGMIYREILWQLSLCSNVKVDEATSVGCSSGGGRTGRHMEAFHVDYEVSVSNAETSSQDVNKKSPEILVLENVNKLASTLRFFFTALVKGLTPPNRRRLLSTSSKRIGTALAKVFLEAFSFQGYSTSAGLDTSLSVKCRYLGKVVDEMVALTFDSRQRTCYTVMINNFYVNGTFKELLTTFEASSQLLWTLPFSHNSWLLNTLQSYCRVLEYFVNPSFLLSPTSASLNQLLVQPVAVSGLSIAVPSDPEMFVRMLQSQVLDVILPVWNHPMFPRCNPGFISTIVSLVTHVYCEVGNAKPSHNGVVLDEATIDAIEKMGFTRARAEEALRRAETNSVEMATEWLFSHAEDPVQEDDELAQALALSLGSSSEASKVEEGQTKAPPIDDILTATVKLFLGSESMVFSLTDLLATLCSRNKGEDRPKVISYLIQQLKLFPLELSMDSSSLCMIAHTLALLLAEDGSTREVAAQNGIVSVAIDILMNFNAQTKAENEFPVPKCISALFLILYNLLECSPRVASDSNQVEKSALMAVKKDAGYTLENVFGKSTAYLTIEESGRVLIVACGMMIKRHVPSMVMQAVLLLCARLTKTHSLALQFLENGGMGALFSISRAFFFPGYDTVASAIIHHLVEDPQTLQTSMEWVIRETLSGPHHARRATPRDFLTSMAPAISRDPEVFMRAAASVCELESSGGRTVVIWSKEKEKAKAPSGELPVKCVKGQKEFPTNLTQVIDQLLEIILKYDSRKTEEETARNVSSMEVDEPATKVKGRSKIEEIRNMELDGISERSTGLPRVTFVLELLSDMLLMYEHSVGIILKRDLKSCRLRGSNQLEFSGHGGIVHHVLLQLLPLPIDRTSGRDEWRSKLSENASWFLVVLCGCFCVGRKLVINELVKALSSFSNLESNSSKTSLPPNEKLLASVELVHSILSKNSLCLTDIAKSMIDGGMIQCLSSVLQVVDLDHPDATKVVNLILKALESLTHAANALNKKKSLDSEARSEEDDVMTISVTQIVEPSQNSNQHEVVTDVEDHDETALEDEDSDDGDDFHDSQAVEMLWREAHDGLDHLQVIGQPGFQQHPLLLRSSSQSTGDLSMSAGTQEASEAAAIAQAVEEHFMSQVVGSIAPGSTQLVEEGANSSATSTQQIEGQHPDEIGCNNIAATTDTPRTLGVPRSGDFNASPVQESDDVDMNPAEMEGHQTVDLPFEVVIDEASSRQETRNAQEASQTDETGMNSEAPNANGLDPTFLEALPEDLRAEVIASQQAQSALPPAFPTAVMEDIDPEFLAALPPDIQAEVLAQQRAQRFAQQAEGQPVDTDNASIIATLPPDLREEVLLTSSEAVLSALPSHLLAEAQMLRDREMSHYQARSSGGNDRQIVMDRGVGVTIGRRASSALAESLKLKDAEGEPILDPNDLKALTRLLRLAQPLEKDLLQRLLLNLCAHGYTREILVRLLLDMIKPETEGSVGVLTVVNSQRLYGCQSNVVYGRSQSLDGLPPLVSRRILEILTYLATNHSAVANILFYFDSSHIPKSMHQSYLENKNDKGKEKIGEQGELSVGISEGDVPLLLFLKLLKQPLFLRSIAHLEQVMDLLQVIVYTAASKLEIQSHSEQVVASSHNLSANEAGTHVQKDSPVGEELISDDKNVNGELSASDGPRSVKLIDIFLQLRQSDLHNLCSLLGHKGLSDKVYTLAGEVLKKLAQIAAPHKKLFIIELSDLAHSLSSSAVNELVTLRNTHMLGLSAGSMTGAAFLRVFQTLNSLTAPSSEENKATETDRGEEERLTMWKLNVALDPLWRELSDCISANETQLAHSSFSSVMSNANVGDPAHQGSSSLSPPLPPGTQRLLPFIEVFFVLCEKLLANNSLLNQENVCATAQEVKEFSVSSAMKTEVDSLRRADSSITFARFSEKHRRLLNAFIRQNPGLLEKSLSIMLKTPRQIDFDNKRAYFRSRIRKQHLPGSLRISVRRAYVLEDSYNQLRMRSSQDLKGGLTVHFQGEEGVDAGGLTREWYQLLSKVIFDKGALLFTTGGNNATFQPNPNSVYQTEHLSYFKFVGRVVAKALFDGQLLDVHLTRSFYKHILGVKVTYHDMEAIDPDYYKNLKWMLENDVSDIPDLTFSMDADEEKHILYEKTEVTDYELKPGGRNIRVTEESKYGYVDLVAEYKLTNAIRTQINSFLDGFNELIPRDLISIFNDKELELLVSGLPEIDLEDLKRNTEYTGYTVGSSAVQWFWEVVNAFDKEDRARLLQFVTGTSKVPLEGFKALQGISGPQRFQIHKAYGAPERLPSAHTCFNQLDLPEYNSKEQLEERLLLAIHEGNEGFGFG